MNNFAKTALVALGLLAGLSAQAEAASSAGWTVTGTITPSPCSITLAGAGVFDYGTVARAALTAQGSQSYDGATFYPLGSRDGQLDVTCPSPTKFAVHFVDAMPGTALFPTAPDYYGFGAVGGQNVGAYFVTYAGPFFVTKTVGGAAEPVAIGLVTQGAATGSSTWEAWNGNFQPNKSYAMGTTGATTPESLVALSMPIRVNAYVNAAVVDTATADVHLAGAGTVSVVLI